MKNSQLFPEQITFALGQAESGTSIPEVCQGMGITEQTFYQWKKKYLGMGIAELRRLRVLEKENRKLKQLLADLSLGKQMLQDVLRKKLKVCSVLGAQVLWSYFSEYISYIILLVIVFDLNVPFR
jgi:putative transposase